MIENKAVLIGAFAAVVAIAAYWLFWSGGFSEADIIKTKIEIQKEFQKRDGVQVVDVELMRENSHKLFGFVKLRIDGLDTEISKSCTATMNDDSSHYIWRCE